MVHLYVSDSAERISLRDGRVTTWSESDGERSSTPVELVESVTVFGLPSISTALLAEMLKRSVDLHLYSKNGGYRGRLTGPTATFAPRLRAQIHASEDREFALEIARRVTAAKIRNQVALVGSYSSDARVAFDVPGALAPLHHSVVWVAKADSIAEVSGFEGSAARAYFAALGMIVPESFAFAGRSTRPPRDAFNSMISFGYSILHRNVVGAIERHGLNPFVGFLHQDGRNHATLASDLMEPWRAPVIDDTVLRLILEGRVKREDFSRGDDGGVRGSQQVTWAIATAFGRRIVRTARFLSDDPKRYTFQYALDLQLQSLVRAIETRNPREFRDIEAPHE